MKRCQSTYPFHGAQSVIDSGLYAVGQFFWYAFVGLEINDKKYNIL